MKKILKKSAAALAALTLTAALAGCGSSASSAATSTDTAASTAETSGENELEKVKSAGKLVIGMGESKALGPFVKACDQFKYLDLILEHGGSEDASADSTAAAEAAAQVGAGDDTAINRDSICRLVCDMIDEMDDGTGWVRTSRVGDQLIKRYPDFDVRNFGSKSLNKFLASFPVLEVEERTLPNGNPIQFVRVHPQPKKAAPKKQNQPRKAAPKRRVPRNKKSS